MSIYDLVNYIIDDHTIMEAVVHFGYSRTYIIKRLKEFRNNPTNIILKEKLELALIRNSIRGRKNGGAKGKKEYVINDEDALKLKKIKERDSLTYRELEELTGISYSNIFNAIERVSALDEKARGR